MHARYTSRKATAALLAATIAVLGTVGMSAASSVRAERSTAQTPTIVLVHGGFADATSSWSPVVTKLQKRGYTVIAPANPLRGLPTDVAYLRSVLEGIDGPVVLVGHSYGGAVITNAAAGEPNVKALVYVAAFVPDVDETLGALISQFPGSEIQAALNPVTFTNADGTTGTDLYLQGDKLRQVFAADLPSSVTRVMAATQRPFSASSFTDITHAAGWHTIPCWGVVATADKAIPAQLERWEYQRAGCQTVEAADASHVVMVSQPDLVTRLIIQAADATN